MSFLIQNFEVNTRDDLVGFAFSEDLGEGQKLYFLGSFSTEMENPGEIAENLFGTVLEAIKSSDKKSSYDTFEEALKAANEQASAHFDKNNKPDTVIAFFDFHQLFLSQSGQAESYLIREQSLSQISEASEKGDDLFLNILNGEINVDDTVIFSSDRLLRTLTSNQILQLFMRDNFAQSCTLLRSELQNTPDEEYLTVCCVGVGKKEEKGAGGFFSRMKLGATEAVSKAVKGKKNDETLPLEKGDTGGSEDNEEVEEMAETLDLIDNEDGGQVEEIPPAAPKVSFRDTFRKVKTNPNLRKAVPIAGVILIAFFIIVGVRALLNYEAAEEKELRASIDIAREALQQADTFLLQGERKSASEYLLRAEESVQMVAKSKSQLFRSDVGFILAEIE